MTTIPRPLNGALSVIGTPDTNSFQQWVERLPAIERATPATTPEPMTAFRRIDRKYVVSADLLTATLHEFEDQLSVEAFSGLRQQRYDTLYFDSPDLRSFHDARAKRPQRGKVRVRSYRDTDETVLEVKRRNRDGMTTKERQPWTGELDDDARRFLHHHLATMFRTDQEVDSFVKNLVPTGRTWYTRIALHHGLHTRITIDEDLAVGSPERATHRFTDQLIVETKSLGSATEFDKSLWARGARPRSISKYAMAVAASHPAQPTNRWTRFTSQLNNLEIPVS